MIGYCDLTITSHDGNILKLEFVVIKTENKAIPILGLVDSEKLNLINKSSNVLAINSSHEHILNSYEHLCNGIGKIKNLKYDFKLKHNYDPVAICSNRVPFRLRDQVKKELDRLCKDNIICEVI